MVHTDDQTLYESLYGLYVVTKFNNYEIYVIIKHDGDNMKISRSEFEEIHETVINAVSRVFDDLGVSANISSNILNVKLECAVIYELNALHMDKLTSFKVIARNIFAEDTINLEHTEIKRNINKDKVRNVLNRVIDNFSARAIDELCDCGFDIANDSIEFSDWLMQPCVYTDGEPQNHWTPIRGKNGGVPEIGGNYRVTIKGQRKGDVSTEICYFDDTEKWFWISRPGRVVAWEDIQYNDEPYIEP